MDPRARAQARNFLLLAVDYMYMTNLEDYTVMAGSRSYWVAAFDSGVVGKGHSLCPRFGLEAGSLLLKVGLDR